MTTMQHAFHPHRRFYEMAGLAVIVGLAVILGVVIGAGTVARPVDPTVSQPPVAAVSSTQAAALAASRADDQVFDRSMRVIKSQAWAVPQPPSVQAPEDSTYPGKHPGRPLPY